MGTLPFLVSLGLPAQAQQTAPPAVSGPGLEEVIVTARRREESAQSVPVAITAMSAEALQEQQIKTPQDLQGRVPSLLITPNPASRDEVFTLRGQGMTFSSAPGVVQYLAEVPLITTRTSGLQGPPGQFLDLVNLQVLRGPQGTLFGRNTTGGAILLEPVKPTDEFEGYLQAQYGNYEHQEIEGVVNVPISDTLQVRLAGSYVDREGFTTDVNTGADYDNRHYYTGRLGVMWTPSDRIENYLMATGTKSESNGFAYVVDEFDAASFEAAYGGPGTCEFVFGFGPGCSAITDAVAAQQQRDSRHVALGPYDMSSEISGWNVVDQLKIDLTDNLALRNIISYSEFEGQYVMDGDGTPVDFYSSGTPVPGTTPQDNLQQFTEEVQLQGQALGDLLQYALGLYYEEIKSADVSTTVGSNLGFPGASRAASETSARAVYGQATLDFGAFSQSLSGLKLTGGMRYTWDKAYGLNGTISLLGPDLSTAYACADGTVPVTLSDCDREFRGESDAPTWTIGLDYQATPDLLLYGKVSRGYKTGGVNTFAVNPEFTTFDPEYVTTYEAGVKSTFRFGDDIGLLLNATAFHTKYDDIQIVALDSDGQNLGAALFNAAQATINGVEIESSLQLGRLFELSGSYSYLDPKYDEYVIDGPFPQEDCSSGEARFDNVWELSCQPFNGIPKRQYSVSARFTLPVPEEWGEMSLGAIYSHIDTTYSVGTPILENEPGAIFDPYGLLNLSANWYGIAGSHLDASLYMTNATDETYRISNTGIWSFAYLRASVYGEPRMYGARLRYSF